MENLIGKKIKGFKFNSDLNRPLNYYPEMKSFVGKIGIIRRVYPKAVEILFDTSIWFYPLAEIQPHLIPLEKQDEFFIRDKKMYSIAELKSNENIIVEFKSIQDWTYSIRLTQQKSAFANTIEIGLYSPYYDSFIIPKKSPSTIRITVDQIKELNIIIKNEENGKSRELPKSSSKDEPRSNRGRVIVRCRGQQVTNAIRFKGDKQSSNASKTRIVKNENIKGVRLK